MMRKWLAANTPNVFPCGRNGMHRYNNQDHSMLTAMLSVENILGGTEHDVWSVNVEAEYHEEQTGDGQSRPGTGRDAPFLPRNNTPCRRQHKERQRSSTLPRPLRSSARATVLRGRSTRSRRPHHVTRSHRLDDDAPRHLRVAAHAVGERDRDLLDLARPR